MDANYLVEYLDGRVPHKHVQDLLAEFWFEQKCNSNSDFIYRILHAPFVLNGKDPSIETLSSLLTIDILRRFKTLMGYGCYAPHNFSCFDPSVEKQVLKERNIPSNGLEGATLGQEISIIDGCQKKVDKLATAYRHAVEKFGIVTEWKASNYTSFDKNIESVWQFMKKCFALNYIKFGKRVAEWCSLCQKQLNTLEAPKHDTNEVSNKAFYAAFPLAGEKKFYLIMQIESAWQMLTMAGAMVHPEYEYCEVAWEGRRYIVGKKNATKVFGNDLVTENVIKGTALHAKRFLMPIEVDDISPKCIVSNISSSMNPAEQTGIVPLMPSLNQSHLDIAIHHKMYVPDIIDKKGQIAHGRYKENKVCFRYQSTIDSEIRDKLRNLKTFYRAINKSESGGVSFTCPDCKTAAITCLISGWHFDLDAIKKDMIKNINHIDWERASDSKDIASSFLRTQNLPVNCNGLWGTPFPFYKCDHCLTITVIGSKKELLERAANKTTESMLEKLTLPYVDLVQVTCPTCGHLTHRFPGVTENWLDTSVLPFAVTKYVEALENKTVDDWRQLAHNWKFLAADLIADHNPNHSWPIYVNIPSFIEEKLVAAKSITTSKKETENHYGRSYSYEEVNKRLFEEFSVDVLRIAHLTSQSNAKVYCEDAKAKEVYDFIRYLLYKCIKFSREFTEPIDEEAGFELTSDLDKWINARFHQTLSLVHRNFTYLDFPNIINDIRDLLHDIFDWYEKMREHDEVYKIHTFLLVKETITLLAPIAPHTSELIWQTVIRKLCPSVPASIFSSRISEVDPAAINKRLLSDFRIMKDIVSAVLTTRNTKKIEDWYTLPRLLVCPEDIEKRNAITRMHEYITKEINVVSIDFVPASPINVHVNYVFTQVNGMATWLDLKIEDALLHANIAKSVTKAVESLRGTKQGDLYVYVTGASPMAETLVGYSSYIKKTAKAYEIKLIEAVPIQLHQTKVKVGKMHFTVAIN